MNATIGVACWEIDYFDGEDGAVVTSIVEVHGERMVIADCVHDPERHAPLLAAAPELLNCLSALVEERLIDGEHPLVAARGLLARLSQ